MQKLWVLLSLCLTLAGCATDSAGRSTAANATPARYACTNQMYLDRASRGRSAPNWNLYDYCMKQHPGG